MALLHNAERYQAAGVETSTHSKYDLAWRRWIEYTHQIELSSDPFLDSFTSIHRIYLLCAFMQSVRDGDYSRGTEELKADTCRQTIDNVAQKFKASGRPDPRCDPDGNISILISRQTRGMKNLDPGVKHEKALPISFYRKIHSSAVTEFDRGVAHLCSGALFFAMRSCEYTKVNGTRRTQTITLSDIRFFLGNEELSHYDPRLHLATTVSITFRYQKRDQRDDTITHHRNLDPLMCPVKSWAFTVRRLIKLPGHTATTTVDTFYNSSTGELARLTATSILQLFHATAESMGFASLGFLPDEIGTHSNRAACAMCMYLNGVPVYTIMIVGRWSSDAFLLYIRKQVQSFTRGVSTSMIQTQSFFTIPNEVANPDDPRTRGNPNKATSGAQRPQIGTTNNRFNVIGPQLHIFH